MKTAIALIILALAAIPLPAQTLANGNTVNVTGTGYQVQCPNDVTTGTTVNLLAKLTPTGCIKATVADTNVPLFIVTGGAGTTGSASLAISGHGFCTMDATTASTEGMYVVESIITDGRCHAQAAQPVRADIIGQMISNSTTAGSLATVQIISDLSSVGPIDLQNQTTTYIADSGVADVYVMTLSPAVTAYVTGQAFHFKATNANSTTTPTLNVSTLGAKTITKNNGSALAPGDIGAGQLVDVEYDGTAMQMQSTLGNAPAGGGGGGAAAPLPNAIGRWFYVTSSATAVSAIGTPPTVTDVGTLTFTAATATNPAFMIMTNNGTTGNAGIGEINGGQSASMRRGTVSTDKRNIDFQARGKATFGSSGFRYFVGMANQAAATMLASDAPALNYAGFYYSSTGTFTGLTDTAHFVCVASDTAQAQTAVNSGVAGDQNLHSFEIIFNDSIPNAKYYIDGALVCTITTNLPGGATSTSLGFRAAVSPNGSSATYSVNFDYFAGRVDY